MCNPPVEFSCDDNPPQRVVSKQFGGMISHSRLIPGRLSIYALGLKCLFKGQDHSSLQYSRNPLVAERENVAVVVPETHVIAKSCTIVWLFFVLC